MDLNGKKIVLTGASSGIGKEILKKLQEYDVKVIAVGRNSSRISTSSKKVIPFSCDISRKEEVDRLFDFALDKLGVIDIFIANAGSGFAKTLMRQIGIIWIIFFVRMFFHPFIRWKK